jgi:(p)ppGpp synthase/HD superfamily hydrolase
MNICGLNRVFEFANALHRNQYRKGTEIPYISHLMSVAGIVMEHNQSIEVVSAALLHDAIEDQGLTWDGSLSNYDNDSDRKSQGGDKSLDRVIGDLFGRDALDLIYHLTESKTNCGVPVPWRIRKQSYLNHLFISPSEAVLIAICDKIHNARSTLADLNTHGAVTWDKFTAGRDDQIWWYNELADHFSSRNDLPFSLKVEFEGLVRRINKCASISIES